MTRPDGMPEDTTARVDQIHANANAHLTIMVEEVALELRTPFSPASTASIVAGRAMRSQPAVIASLFAAALVRLAHIHGDQP